MKRSKVRTEKGLKRLYKQLNPSGHWFDPGTMNWFNSRIEPYFKSDNGAIFFISSEKYDNEARGYTVRKLGLKNGEIKTITEFCKLTKNQAVTVFNDIKPDATPVS